MAKTLKDLVLALLNATLILIALCLFLGWKLTSTVNGMMGEFAGNLAIVAPMREEVSAMTAELQGLRADLAELKAGNLDPAIADRLQTRLQTMGARVDGIETRLDDLAQMPEALLDHAIESAGDSAARAVNDMRGCVAPGSV